ncbi:MAG: mucoidy inhibitor MuiA family protein [Balneola sp.]
MAALLFSFILLSNFQSSASDSSIVTSEITQVTVFKNQAQVQRKSEVILKSGTTVIVFTGLSETLVDQSIQLKGSGVFTLLSLTTRNDFTEKTVYKTDIQVLRDRKVEIQQQIAGKQAVLEVIQHEINMLASTQEIIKNNKLTPSEINALISLYRTNLSELLNKRIATSNELHKLQSELEKVNRQINESFGTERTSFKEVIAEVQLDSPQKIEFILEYQVYSAGWIASYDIRSSDINSPLDISYKAKIYQNTGIDWKDVKFVINSGDPTSNATKPELNTNYVGYYSSFYRNNRSVIMPSNVLSRKTNEVSVISGVIKDEHTGESLPGVTIFLEGIDRGTSTSADGYFQISQVRNGYHVLRVNSIGFVPLRIPVQISNNGLYLEIPLEEDIVGLDELVVTGYSSRNKVESVTTAVVQAAPSVYEPQVIQNQEVSNQTSFSYEIAIPYSVPSDGKYHTVEIKNEAPKTDYKYSTVPKLSKFAYLIGNIPDWNELNLIEGEANIYFDNRFVGTTFLDPVSLEDTLSVSLGKDERIVIDRKQLKEFSTKNFFRNRTRENLQFEISVRNTKAQAITIMIEDQIPISTNEEIKVSVNELSDGKLEEDTGIVTWELTIEPGETQRIRFGFEIEYPKGKRIVY